MYDSPRGVFFFPLFFPYTSLDAPVVGSALPQKRPSSFWGAPCYVRLILLPPAAAASHPPASAETAPASFVLGVKTLSASFSLSCLPVSLLLPLSLHLASLSLLCSSFKSLVLVFLLSQTHTLTKAGWSLLSRTRLKKIGRGRQLYSSRAGGEGVPCFPKRDPSESRRTARESERENGRER